MYKDDPKVTRRLLKEKSKLTFVDVSIKIFIACLLKGSQQQFFSSRHSIYGIYRYGGRNHNIRAWRTWSWVSSELENVKWLLQPWELWTLEHLNIGTLEYWTCEHLKIWRFGHLNIWIFVHLNIWSSENLKIWTSEYLNIWTSEHMNIWTSEYWRNGRWEHLNIWTLKH